MKFRISGEIKIGSEQRKFTKEVEAQTENHAKELVYSLFGSHSGIKRTNVKMTEIKKVE